MNKPLSFSSEVRQASLAGKEPATKETEMTVQANVHCQVCAREIKAGNGRIAKHGYRRPGHGWQTASCFGAGFAPYEVAHDALDRWIVALNRDIPRAETFVAELIASPPATYDYVARTDAYGRAMTPKQTLQRPEPFDAQAAIARGAYRPGTYEMLFAFDVSKRRRDIVGMKQALEYATERRKAWKAQ
jgi:hypothetical protein